MKLHVGIKVEPDGRRVAVLAERGPARSTADGERDKVRVDRGGTKVA